jgi:hypothetical protein
MGDKKEVKKSPAWPDIKNHADYKNPALLLKKLVEFKVTEAPEAQFKKVKKDYMSDPNFTKEALTKLS